MGIWAGCVGIPFLWVWNKGVSPSPPLPPRHLGLWTNVGSLTLAACHIPPRSFRNLLYPPSLPPNPAALTCTLHYPHSPFLFTIDISSRIFFVIRVCLYGISWRACNAIINAPSFWSFRITQENYFMLHKQPNPSFGFFFEFSSSF